MNKIIPDVVDLCVCVCV